MAEPVYPAVLSNTPGAPVSRLLSTGGDESGTINAAANYSITPGTFYYVTPGARAFIWTELHVLYTDGGGFDVAKMGNNITITNGIHVRYLNSDQQEVSALQGALRVKTNGDWGLLAGVDFEYKDFGAGDNAVVVRWKWPDPGCYCPVGYRISTTLTDNLSALTSLRFMLHGRRLT